MLRTSLAVLALASFAVLALAMRLASDLPSVSDGLLWGLSGGILAALTAVGGAYWAEAKGKTVQQALAVVVVGMLFRMFFLGGWTLLAVFVGDAHAFAFLGGFGAIYLVGQALEVWMLVRLKAASSPAPPAA